jgi:hypothetical protein
MTPLSSRSPRSRARRPAVAGLVAFVLACLIGCRSPSVPSRLALEPGRYVIVTSPEEITPTTCSGPGLGGSIVTLVTLSRNGSEWVARSESGSNGDVELRFHEVEGNFGVWIATDGTLHGTGQDSRNAFSTVAGSVSFSGANQLGSASVFAGNDPTSSYARDWLSGEITGTIRFVDSFRGERTCTRASFGLRPPGACELAPNVPCS